MDTVSDPPVPPVEIAVFRESRELEQAISDSRLLIGVILAAVLLGALGFSALVVRAPEPDREVPRGRPTPGAR